MIKPDLELERELWNQGYSNLVGVDEAGRGPWAGPLVAGAVMLPDDHQISIELYDSKQMSVRKREDAFKAIERSEKINWGVGLVSSEAIDEMGITVAVRLAMEAAIVNIVNECSCQPGYLIIDGANVKGIPNYRQKRVNNADRRHYSVAAASVVAKVIRDRIMIAYAEQYPEYGFHKHKGYGTKEHQKALIKYGPCPIHRKSFAPIKNLSE